MNSRNRAGLADRIVKAAETSLAAQHYVRPIDVLTGIGWLDPGAEKRWRQAQIDCLEGAVQASLPRLSEAKKLFRSWAGNKGLLASETDYVARTPSDRGCASAGAATRRSKNCTGLIGYRPSFPRGSVSA
jgi:hypothetical protein